MGRACVRACVHYTKPENKIEGKQGEQKILLSKTTTVRSTRVSAGILYCLRCVNARVYTLIGISLLTLATRVTNLSSRLILRRDADVINTRARLIDELYFVLFKVY